MRTSRLEAFSDGVLAIIITIMVLELEVPHEPTLAALGDSATGFFTTATRNMHEAGVKSGVQRLVVVSIIGTDKATGGYGAAKLAHERAALAWPIPARILRAAQFHEFVEVLMGWGRQGDVVYLPKMRTQVVAARTVAEALADLALSGEPEGERPDEIAGPR